MHLHVANMTDSYLQWNPQPEPNLGWGRSKETVSLSRFS